MKNSNQRDAGITLLEVMIVVGILAILVVLLLPAVIRPMSKGKALPPRITCVHNLKQVGLAFRMWDMDHGDRFPMSLAVTNGGTLDHPQAAEAWVHYQLLSNELVTPKILLCPADLQMKLATDFDSGFGSNNVSYLVGLDADELLPNWILSGDRNLTTNGVALKPGFHVLNTHDVVGFTKALHNQCGNIGLSDGSVQQFTASAFQNHLQDNPQTNRLAIP